jgi:peroxiredoxin
VTLDQYAKLCKAVAGASLKDEAEVDQWAQQQGLQTGQFKRVSDEFTKRMGTNRALTNRFGMLYAQG